MKRIILWLLPVFLVFSMAWIGYGSDKNLERPVGDVDFVWIDGRFEIVYNPTGDQYRPLLRTFEFVSTLGTSAKSLVIVVAETAQELKDNWNPDANLVFPQDAEWYDYIMSVLDYIGEGIRSIFNLVVTIVLLPFRFGLWVLTIIPYTLGFVVLGTPLYDLAELVKVINGIGMR